MSVLSFTPSQERLALADSAARVLRERYPLNEERQFDATRWREFAELGWLAGGVSERNGGLALPWSTVSVVAETLAPAAALEPFASQVSLVGHVLDAAAPCALRDAALAAWLRGEEIITLAHHEGEAAPWSDAAGDTGFRRDGDGYLLRGRIPLVLDGALARRHLVCAWDGQGELALFVVERGSAGLRCEPRTGIDGRAHQALALDDVRVARAARLEFVDGAVEVLNASAWLHALMLSAEAVGLLTAMLRASHEYLVQREQFARPLIEFQVLQHRLVDMLLTLTRLESLLDMARCKCDELGPIAAAPYIAAAKAACGEEGRALARQAVQLHGAIGLTAELALGRQLRRLMALELMGGTSAEHMAWWTARRGALTVD